MVDDDTKPLSQEVKAKSGWLFTRRRGAYGHGVGIVIGPNLRKLRLNLPTEVVLQWVKDAPKKATLWTSTHHRLLPKHRLLVVLEEWTSPTWSRISWDENDDDSEVSALGLWMPDAEAKAPSWMHLALPGQTVVCSNTGNTEVRTDF